VLHLIHNHGMTKSAIIHARIEPSMKIQAENVLQTLGLNPTEAIRLFYHQICLQKGLPFSVSIPNPKTKETLHKSIAGEDVTKFNNLDEMFDSWE
jgi:DNA-damage-inducible protein J